MQQLNFKAHLGLILVLIASFSFASMNALSKLAQEYTNPSMVLFFRFTIAFTLLWPMILYEGGLKSLKTKVPFKHLMRAITGFTTLTLMILAVNYTSLTNALLLNITYPLFTPLILLIAYKKTISLTQMVGLTIGFLGVILVLRPDATHLFDSGSFLALLSGLAAAIAIQLTKVLGRTESNTKIGFYLFGFSSFVSSLLVLFFWETPSFTLLLLLFGTGVVGFIYQQSLSYAINLTNTTFVTNMLFTSIIFGSLYNWLIWRETLSLYTYLGLTLIIFGTFIAWIQSKHEDFSYEAKS